MTPQCKNKTNKTNKTRKNRVFNKSDYNNGDGMLTSVWGPSMWHYLHTMSFNYPIHPTPEDKKHYLDFMLSLQYVLPCKYCRMNLKTNYKQLPITITTMKDRDSFSRYVYNLHELVNKMLHKKSNLSYCDVRERYEHFRSRCTQDAPKIFTLNKLKTLNKTNKSNKKETGCTEPLYGKKAKCIIKIVPHDEKGSTFQMDKKCVKTRKLK
jgi:hypothetical protein